jgi:hypothetical protein
MNMVSMSIMGMKTAANINTRHTTIAVTVGMALTIADMR